MPPIVSRGFGGRRRGDAPPGRVPPGQYVTRGFPVLSAGPTPHTPLERWDFLIVGEVDKPRRWTWEEFRALPSEEITTDIHCVTRWSKLDTVWRGVRLDMLLEGIETSARYTVAFSDGGYTTKRNRIYGGQVCRKNNPRRRTPFRVTKGMAGTFTCRRTRPRRPSSTIFGLRTARLPRRNVSSQAAPGSGVQPDLSDQPAERFRGRG